MSPLSRGFADWPCRGHCDLGPVEDQTRETSQPGGYRTGVVVSDLVEDVKGGLLGSAGGRFFAWAIGGSVPAALAADWLTSAWDQNAALYACSPAAAIAEEVAGEWLKDLRGIPASASFAFVSGCQMAHACCLAAARHALLLKRDWDVERKGLCAGYRRS